jgi:hypothetical protein
MEQMHAEERHVWAYKNMCRREVVQAKARGRWLRRALAWRVDSARIYNVAHAEANSTTFKKSIAYTNIQNVTAMGSGSDAIRCADVVVCCEVKLSVVRRCDIKWRTTAYSQWEHSVIHQKQSVNHSERQIFSHGVWRDVVLCGTF